MFIDTAHACGVNGIEGDPTALILSPPAAQRLGLGWGGAARLIKLRCLSVIDPCALPSEIRVSLDFGETLAVSTIWEFIDYELHCLLDGGGRFIGAKRPIDSFQPPGFGRNGVNAFGDGC